MRTSGVTWIVPALLTALAAGAAPPPSTRPADVEGLIRQLSGDDWSLRQKAQQTLVDLGADAEPALRQWVAQSHDQESIARAQAALRLIAEARLVGPTLVTVHLHGVDPAGALEEIGRQLGQDVAPEPPDLWKQKDWPRVTLDADRQPFWRVMLGLCGQLNLEPQPTEGAGVGVGEATDVPAWASSPSVVAGPFLVMATGATRTRSVRFAQPADVDQTCEVTLSAYAEPKLHPIHDSFAVQVESATDGHGRSLLPADPNDAADAVSFTEPDPGRRWDVSLDLKLPAIGVGQKPPAATIKGAMTVLVPVKLRSIEVPDVLETRDLARRAAGRRLTVVSARRANGNVEVKVTLFRDELTDDEWQQFNDPRDFVHLVDNAGHVTPLTSVSETETGERQTTQTLQFSVTPTGGAGGGGAGAAGPMRFVWQVPEEIRSVRVRFEYRDLPLP